MNEWDSFDSDCPICGKPFRGDCEHHEDHVIQHLLDQKEELSDLARIAKAVHRSYCLDDMRAFRERMLALEVALRRLET